ncbi:hypothetical protein [Ruminococcus sp.]|uniref:hypothetical protein n=1 Tax=Ruminococcus sp. TaxID=41978 RepID=UPI00388DAAC7
MRAYSMYTIKFNGEPDDIKKVLPIIDEKLGYNITEVTDVIKIEDESLVWVEKITEELAQVMAETAPNLTFTIDGCVDTSESAGEYMDFSISYRDGKITAASSCWYIYFYGDDYEDYEEFCEEFLDDEDNPRFTEEEFE